MKMLTQSSTESSVSYLQLAPTNSSLTPCQCMQRPFQCRAKATNANGQAAQCLHSLPALIASSKTRLHLHVGVHRVIDDRCRERPPARPSHDAASSCRICIERKVSMREACKCGNRHGARLPPRVAPQ